MGDMSSDPRRDLGNLLFRHCWIYGEKCSKLCTRSPASGLGSVARVLSSRLTERIPGFFPEEYTAVIYSLDNSCGPADKLMGNLRKGIIKTMLRMPF
ncbi:hypothetical protein DsansV1_C13g0121081 [Dioscorea sansibarensis]